MHRPSRFAAVAATLVPLALSGALATSAEARTRKPLCEPGVQWTSDTRGFDIEWKRGVNNKTSSPVSKTFTIDKTTTVSLKASASLEVETSAGFGPFSASVKGQFGIEASKSVTVSAGESETLTVQPWHRMVYRYGVVVRRLRGYNLVDPATFIGPLGSAPGLPAGCTLRSRGVVTAVIPQFAGSDPYEKRIKKPRKRS